MTEIDQLSEDFVAAYANWLGVTEGEAYALLKLEPLVDITDDLQAAAYEERKHPRYPKGHPKGGQFKPKDVPDTFVGEQGFARGPGKVRIEGERPRMLVSEMFVHENDSLQHAVPDWPELKDQEPEMESVYTGDLWPTQGKMSAVRIEEYAQEVRQDGNLEDLLSSVRVVEGIDGHLYIADGHNRVAAAMRLGHQQLYLPVIRRKGKLSRGGGT